MTTSPRSGCAIDAAVEAFGDQWTLIVLRDIRSHLRARGIKAVIPEPDDQKVHRMRRGSRAGGLVRLDAADYRNRNVIERGYCRIQQWRGLATRYDKHAVIYRAAVVLNANIARTIAPIRHGAARETRLPAAERGASLTRMTDGVRELVEDDWDAFWPMLKDMGTDDDAATARPRFAALVQDPRWGVLGIVQQGELVGYAAIQDHGPHLRLGDLHRMARLHDLYVLPGARRQGIGSRLMEGVQSWTAARARYLEWQASPRLAPFYEHLGHRGEPCPQPEYPTYVIDFVTLRQAQGT